MAICLLAGFSLGPLLGNAGHTAAREGSVSWAQSLDQSPAWYASAEAIRIADNVLLYQRRSGGWPKNVDMAGPLVAGDRDRVRTERDLEDATIDNGATCSQLRYLARVEAATGLDRFREPFGHGLDYLLAAQYPNGGWPQFFPLRDDYSRHITFNDGAMIGVMRLLRDVAAGAPPFGFVDPAQRRAAASAVARGLRVLLQAQIRVDGRLTAWCAQHDEVTLEPRGARRYEVASLSGRESVEIVEYLMEIPQPEPGVVQSVEAAVAWLRAARIEGLRVERVAAPGAPGGIDVVARPDPEAPPLWARFYEIGSNRPLFAGRDGIVRYALAEIEHERRTRYSWLGPYAADLLERRYAEWHSRVGARPAGRPASDAVVATDGSGDFLSLQAAIAAAPTASREKRWIIYVKAGVYRELVYVQREKRFLHLLGQDPEKTVVTYDLHANLAGPDGKPIGTFRTPTAVIDADDFTAENLTFENPAGTQGQALAVRVDGDRVAFRNCRFVGWQDTLFLNRGRQYLEDCFISGHVDFIFGGATAFFERCLILARKDGYLTAASTPEELGHGFVFSRCTIRGGGADVRTYLGRPWRSFASVAFLQTEMTDVVRPAGWDNWSQPSREKTARFAEYGSTGPGANPEARVAWARRLRPEEASALTAAKVLGGGDGWDPQAEGTFPARR